MAASFKQQAVLMPLRHEQDGSWAVLRSWLFGRPPESFSFRRRLAIVMGTSRFGTMWDLSQTLFSILGCVTYVMATYDQNNGGDQLDEFLVSLFLADFLLRWYICADRLHYLWADISPSIDLLCILPPLIQWIGGPAGAQLTFARFLRILRIVRIIRSFSVLQRALSPVHRQVLLLVLITVSLMFVNAGLMNLVEDQQWGYFSGGLPANLAPGLTFGNAMWLSLVTMTTIGYGDFYPQTVVGKLIMSTFIIVSVIVVPLQINALTEVMALRSKYFTPFRPNSTDLPHLLIVGCISDSRVLSEFLKEIYHPDRVQVANNSTIRKTVIMGPEEPADDLKALLVSPFFDTNLQYVKGSVSSGEDLARVAADRAEACFVLSEPVPNDPELEDRSTALRTLNIKNFAPSCNMYIQLTRAVSLLNVDHSDEVTAALCMDEWKSHLLAQSALIPGFATLLTNLLRTAAEPSDALAATLHDWALEYSHGASQEVYCLPLSGMFDGMAYSKLVSLVYEEFAGTVTVMAVREPNAAPHTPAAKRRLKGLSRRRARGSILSSAILTAVAEGMRGEPVRGMILLNPGPNYRLCAGQAVYLLASDSNAAAEVMSEKRYTAARDAGSFEETLSTEGRDPEMFCYGYPLNHESRAWSWGKNARMEVALNSWLGDYVPSHLSEKLAEELGVAEETARRTCTAGERNRNRRWQGGRGAGAGPSADLLGRAQRPAGPLDRVVEGGAPAAAADGPAPSATRVKALLVWARIRRHIRQKVFERRFVTRSITSDVRKRRRRLSTNVISAQSRIVFGGEGKPRKLFMDVVSQVDANRERGAVLRQLIVEDVREAQPDLHGHIIVCASLAAFAGFLSPLRSAHMVGTGLYRHVVLLASYDESAAAQPAIENLAYYGGTTVIIGSITSTEDLLRAGISTASCTVILGESRSPGVFPGMGLSGPVDTSAVTEALDGSVIFAYLTLEQALASVSTHPSFYVVVELKSALNIQVLNSKRMSKLRVAALWKEHRRQDKAAKHLQSSFDFMRDAAFLLGQGARNAQQTVSGTIGRSIADNLRTVRRKIHPTVAAAQQEPTISREASWAFGPTIGHAASFVRPTLPDFSRRGSVLLDERGKVVSAAPAARPATSGSSRTTVRILMDGGAKPQPPLAAAPDSAVVVTVVSSDDAATPPSTPTGALMVSRHSRRQQEHTFHTSEGRGLVGGMLGGSSLSLKQQVSAEETEETVTVEETAGEAVHTDHAGGKGGAPRRESSAPRVRTATIAGAGTGASAPREGVPGPGQSDITAFPPESRPTSPPPPAPHAAPFDSAMKRPLSMGGSYVGSPMLSRPPATARRIRLALDTAGKTPISPMPALLSPSTDKSGVLRGLPHSSSSSQGPVSQRVAAPSIPVGRGATMDFSVLGGPFSLPFFAAGYAIASDTLNSVLVQSFYDAEVVRFAEELLTPCPDRASRLLIEPVPRRFHRRSYAELFRDMLHSYNVVVMGLYRARRTLGAPMNYVYTGPDPATTLYSAEDDEDLMYVLSPQPLFTGACALAPHEVADIEQQMFSPKPQQRPPLEKSTTKTGGRVLRVQSLSSARLQVPPPLLPEPSSTRASFSSFNSSFPISATEQQQQRRGGSEAAEQQPFAPGAAAAFSSPVSSSRRPPLPFFNNKPGPAAGGAAAGGRERSSGELVLGAGAGGRTPSTTPSAAPPAPAAGRVSASQIGLDLDAQEEGAAAGSGSPSHSPHGGSRPAPARTTHSPAASSSSSAATSAVNGSSSSYFSSAASYPQSPVKSVPHSPVRGGTQSIQSTTQAPLLVPREHAQQALAAQTATANSIASTGRAEQRLREAASHHAVPRERVSFSSQHTIMMPGLGGGDAAQAPKSRMHLLSSVPVPMAPITRGGGGDSDASSGTAQGSPPAHGGQDMGQSAPRFRRRLSSSSAEQVLSNNGIASSLAATASRRQSAGGGRGWLSGDGNAPPFGRGAVSEGGGAAGAEDGSEGAAGGQRGGRGAPGGPVVPMLVSGSREGGSAASVP